jgi:predicted alpha/beta-fold hydrolase
MRDGGTVGLDIVLDSEAQYTKGLEVDEELKHRKDYVKNLPPRIRYMQAVEEAELLQSEDDRPMLVSLHGLSGGSHESYVRALLRDVVKSGRWAACSLNARGCGRTTITTQQLFCANWTGIYLLYNVQC